jgi:hypothetical protein
MSSSQGNPVQHSLRLLTSSFGISLCALAVGAAAEDGAPGPRNHVVAPITVRLSDPVPPQPQQPVLLEPLAGRIGGAIGFGQADEQLVGAGPRYRVHFGEHGPLITTPLGAEATRSLPLSFELESIRRGGQQLAGGGPSTPARQGDAVVYARGPSIVERYDLLREGVEQSFVIDNLPAGEGDLVVRGRLISELDAPAPGIYPNGLSFRAPQWNGSTQGGVEIGSVTGIDAAGARVPGAMRWDGTHVEYSLPAEFVAAARMPLVVDPLFGAGFTAASGADYADPDVAWDDSSASYLVVFERQWSGSDIDTYAQQLLPNGTPVGGLKLLETGIPTLAINPSVGNVNGTNRFFVAWQQGSSILGPWDIYGLSMSNSGAVSATIAIATEAASEIEPDVAGQRWTPNLFAPVVWERVGNGIFGASIDVPSTANPSIAYSYTIAPEPYAHRPSISQGQDEAGVYLVVFSRFYTNPFPGDHDVIGIVINSKGEPYTSLIQVMSSLGPDEDNADVVASLDDFAVVYEFKDSIDDLDRGVHVQRLHFDTVALTLQPVGPAVVIEDDPFLDERSPAIAYTGLKFHVAYLDQRADIGYDLALRELDPADCLPCSQKLVKLGSASTSLFAPALTSRFAGAAQQATDECLLAYESVSNTPSFSGSIVGQLWESVGATGSVVNLGGGCAGGGTAGTLGVIAPGTPSVTLTLTGAAPTAVLSLVNLNPGPAALFPCGSCLAPLPGILINRPIVAGNSSLFIPTPCDAALIGAVLDFDWKVVGVPTTPCPLVANLANSNVLRLTIGH